MEHNLAWLLDRMAACQDREAMIHGHDTITYAELLEEYARWSSRLSDNGVMAGEVVLLAGDYSPATCGAILACIANGCILVPISARHPNRAACAAIAGADVEFDFTEEDGGCSIKRVSRSRRPELLDRFSARKRAGLVLFTSGSTGTPKAILHDLAPMMMRYREARPARRTLTFLLFDHIGGWNTFMHTIANGGTVITAKNRSPKAICVLIEQHRIELLPATPSFLNMLLMTEADRQYDLSSLTMITFGTEVMPDYTLQQLRERMPHVRLKQTYGLSEVGILGSKSKEDGSPWMTIGGEGVETKVVDGILHIRSRTAMVGYLNAPNPFDPEGWFDTQDQVVTDGSYIRVLGRRSEIINVGGRKVYPVEVETVLLQMDELADAVVRSEPHPIVGSIVVAVVNTAAPIDSRELKERIRRYCRDKLESYQIPVKVYIEEAVLFSERHKKKRQA
jgi:long-chain acyl-CoA synthetase